MSLATTTLAPPQERQQRSGTMGDGSQTRGRSTSSVDRQSDYSSGTAMSSTSSAGSNGSANGGILCNAHEAPKNKSRNDSALRTALKAAFIPPQPGKMMKTTGKPLGKSFHRTEPLPQTHAGGEVLKVDPRGPDAHVGDGVVLDSTSSTSETSEEAVEGDTEEEKAVANGRNASPDSMSSDGSEEYLSPAPSKTSTFDDAIAAQANRSRSNTASTQMSSTSSSTNPCSIKFAPLPSSGRLKRANSITIGVAARSQLLHSQGAGRQQSNAQQWQSAQHQLRAHQYHQQQQALKQQGGGGGGDQQAQHGRGRSDTGPSQLITSVDPVDLGDELRKGAKKAWSRVRRGSSVSSGDNSSRERPADGSAAVPTGAAATLASAADPSHVTGGDKTPRRAPSPQRLTTVDDDELPEGAQTPRHSMQRRVSTGAFTGQQSFLSVEEKRRRELRGDDGRGRDVQDDERENEATRFIEMLGSTGAGRESYHMPSDRGRRRQDGAPTRKELDVVQPTSESESESIDSSSNGGDETNGTDVDDEEEREAERMADAALKSHSAQATKAGAVEKMEKKRMFSLGRRS